jgi:hypothetical protein
MSALARGHPISPLNRLPVQTHKPSQSLGNGQRLAEHFQPDRWYSTRSDCFTKMSAEIPKISQPHRIGGRARLSSSFSILFARFATPTKHRKPGHRVGRVSSEGGKSAERSTSRTRSIHVCIGLKIALRKEWRDRRQLRRDQMWHSARSLVALRLVVVAPNAIATGTFGAVYIRIGPLDQTLCRFVSLQLRGTDRN